jgi:hypothetical protein
MAAAGGSFIPSSLPNSRLKKVCNPCKIKSGVDKEVFLCGVIYFRLPTYQNGDENP